MQLYIGNKNYSSWSLRPWLAMTQLGIPFDEVKLRLDFGDGSAFKTALAGVGAPGRVPVLVDDGFAVWDTLAIAEYLHDRFPEKGVWPTDLRHRARARSLCAEMHAGFGALRNHCPMNLEAHLPQVGAQLMETRADVPADVARIEQMWTEQLAASGGPFLFGEFGAVDAYYAPVVSRMRTYALPLGAAAQAYVGRVWQLPAMQSWESEALAEHDWLDHDEPYRSKP